jgi:hypothetical protein
MVLLKRRTVWKASPHPRVNPGIQIENTLSW